MINGCKHFFFKQKAIHDSNAFFNAESIDFFIIAISYTVPEINKKITRKMGLQKILYLNVYHLFFN